MYVERYDRAVSDAEKAERDFHTMLREATDYFFDSGLHSHRMVTRRDAAMQALTLPSVKDALWDHRFAVDKAVMYGLGAILETLQKEEGRDRAE